MNTTRVFVSRRPAFGSIVHSLLKPDHHPRMFHYPLLPLAVSVRARHAEGNEGIDAGLLLFCCFGWPMPRLRESRNATEAPAKNTGTTACKRPQEGIRRPCRNHHSPKLTRILDPERIFLQIAISSVVQDSQEQFIS
jgi:hypothetical protein